MSTKAILLSATSYMPNLSEIHCSSTTILLKLPYLAMLFTFSLICIDRNVDDLNLLITVQERSALGHLETAWIVNTVALVLWKHLSYLRRRADLFR